VLAMSAVDCGFEPPSAKLKTKMWHFCYSSKHAVLMRKSKY
jgi:hypothetical protein